MVGISEESDQITGIWNSFTQIQCRNKRISGQKLQCQEKMTKDKILGNNCVRMKKLRN